MRSTVLLAIFCWTLLMVSGYCRGSALPYAPDQQVDWTYAASAAEAPPKCMDDLGCFPIGPEFFHALYRPINLVPADREKINTKFLLYTKAHPKTAMSLRAKNKKLLEQSGFDVTKQTKVIIHGWIDNQVFGEWMRTLKDELLLGGDYNVIIVDWSGGNTLPYTQATANTRVVGAEVAFLLQWLKDTQGLKLEDCHILGHSLGSHVSGYAGERLKKLGRITGLDPAEPYFQNMPPSVRLDPTDADFVDVIHTDSRSILLGGLGMSQLVGHVDFFPNDGHKQPGCGRAKILDFFTEGLVGGVRSFVACNHMRAVDFVRASVNRHQCVFTGYACPDWKTFQNGDCANCGAKGTQCAHMGLKAADHYRALRNDTRQQQFFLQTGPNDPFCLYQYQVSVTLNKSGPKDHSGSLKVSIAGDKREESFKLNGGSSVSMVHGATYTFLITTDTELGELSSVTFSWDGGFRLPFFPKKYIILDSVKIVPMNIIETNARAAQTRKFCASNKGPLESRTDITFRSSDKC